MNRNRQTITKRDDRASARRRPAPLPLALLVAVSLLSAAAVPADANRTIELLEAGMPSMARKSELEAGVVRERAAVVEYDALIDAEVRKTDRIVFDLFADAALEGIVERVDRSGTRRFSVEGSIAGHPMGNFQMVVHGDAVVANVQKNPNERYEIRVAPDGMPVVRQVTAIHPHGCGVTEAMIERTRERAAEPGDGEAGGGEPGDERSGGSSIRDKIQSGEPIDILVLWTENARLAAGTKNAMKALVQLSITTTFGAYANSSINTQIRLAGWKEVIYEEGGDTLETHLTRLQDIFDGFLDEEALVLRNDTGADIVSLFLNSQFSDSLCGLAYISPYNEDFAFQVVHWSCAAAANGWTFAHELGHNLGSGHDVGDGGGVFNYARGHSFVGNSAQTWRTIMVRQSQPGTRIQYFSNPLVNFDGQPTGIIPGQAGEADNKSTFQQTDDSVCGNLPSWPRELWVDLDYGGLEFGTEDFPYNTIAEGLANIGWDGVINVRGSSPETFENEKGVFLRSYSGDPVIGK